jgi:hypothetical protein
MEQKRKKERSFLGSRWYIRTQKASPKISFFLNLLLKTCFLKKKKTPVTGIAKPKPFTSRVVAPSKDATNEKKS